MTFVQEIIGTETEIGEERGAKKSNFKIKRHIGNRPQTKTRLFKAKKILSL